MVAAMLVRPHPVLALVLVPLALGCPAAEPPATETESSSTTADSSTTVVPPTTLDSSGTTVVPDTSTSSDTSTTSVDTSATDTSGTSSGSSSDDTTGGVVCEEPFEPNEDIGTMVGLAVVMGTNLGAGDHYADLCGLRTFGSDTDFTDTDVFPDTDTGFFPGTTGFTDTFPPTTSVSDTLPTTGFTSFGSFTDTFPGTTGFTDTFPGTDSLPTTGFTTFSDTGFDTEFQPPTYEEYVVRWTAPDAGTYRIDLVGSDYDTMLGIADECGAGEIECNDDCFELQSGLAVAVDDGQTITIIIGGYAGQVGEFVLNIEEDAGFECPGFK